jgi:hypothetical protein
VLISLLSPIATRGEQSWSLRPQQVASGPKASLSPSPPGFDELVQMQGKQTILSNHDANIVSINKLYSSKVATDEQIPAVAFPEAVSPCTSDIMFGGVVDNAVSVDGQ